MAATKTFVTSVLAGLSLLAEWQRDADLRRALASLPDALAQAVTLDWSPLADRLVAAGSFYVLGRGPAIAIAAEAALKGKEVCGLNFRKCDKIAAGGHPSAAFVCYRAVRRRGLPSFLG